MFISNPVIPCRVNTTFLLSFKSKYCNLCGYFSNKCPCSNQWKSIHELQLCIYYILDYLCWSEPSLHSLFVRSLCYIYSASHWKHSNISTCSKCCLWSLFLQCQPLMSINNLYDNYKGETTLQQEFIPLGPQTSYRHHSQVFNLSARKPTYDVTQCWQEVLWRVAV